MDLTDIFSPAVLSAEDAGTESLVDMADTCIRILNTILAILKKRSSPEQLRALWYVLSKHVDYHIQTFIEGYEE